MRAMMRGRERRLRDESCMGLERAGGGRDWIEEVVYLEGARRSMLGGEHN